MLAFPKPFAIGLTLLDLKDWLDVDQKLRAYLHEKDRLHRTKLDDVFMSEDGTSEAQQEALNFITAHLLDRFPEVYQREGSGLSILGERIVQSDPATPPLLTAALMVQEDLVLLRRSNHGWRLVAASLCFPTSWSLKEKFGRPITDIHGPVPEFSRGTRNAMMVERIFDNLSVDKLVQRQNWSLYADDELHHPRITAKAPNRFDQTEFLNDPFIRVEGQALRKLPQSGDILFTIRIYVERMNVLLNKAEARQQFHLLADRLEGMSEAELDYKGLSKARSALVRMMREL